MELAGGQKKSLELHRGLFLIRYDSAADVSSPPRLVLSPEGWARSDLELILPPDADEPVLWSPGECIAVRANREGRVIVSVLPAKTGGSTDAKIQLVPLSQDPRKRRKTGGLIVSEFRLLGHLSGLGDVRVAANEWLGGPTTPARIEGIALETPDLPGSIRLRYSVRTGGARPIATPMIDAGTFAGTRGRALPLVGVAFEISGPGVSQYAIVSEAIFLGSSVIRVSGQKVVLAGPTGREPLVGLQVSITESGHSAEDTDRAAPAQEKAAVIDHMDLSFARIESEVIGTKRDAPVRVFRPRPPKTTPDVRERPTTTGREVSAPAESRSGVKVFSRASRTVKSG